MPVVNGDQIRLNLNASSTAPDTVKVDWKVEEEDNETDITYLLKKNIKLVCQNTMKDDDRQVIELKRDQTEYEVVDLEDNSHYMIEIEIQFEKGGLQFSEKTLVKTLQKSSPTKLLPDPALDNDVESNNIDTSSKDSPIDVDSVNQPDFSDYSTVNKTTSTISTTSSTTSTTPESIFSSSLQSLLPNANTSAAEGELKTNEDSKKTKFSIDRADIDPVVSINNNEENVIMTDKRLINEAQNIPILNSTSTTTTTSLPIIPNELPAYNDSENLLGDFKSRQKLVEENDLNSYRKPTYDREISNQTNDERLPINSTTGIDKSTADDAELERKLLIDLKLLDKFDLTKNDTNTAVNSGRSNEEHNGVIDSSNQNTTLVSSTTSTTTERPPLIDEKPVASNEIIDDKLNDKVKNKDNLPVDSLLNEPNRNEEQVDNQNANNSIDDRINEFKKPFLKRLDHSQPDEQLTNNQTSTNHTLDENLGKDEDKLINNLNLQDNQLKSKLDLFDRVHNQTDQSISNESMSSTTESSLLLPITLPSTSTTTQPSIIDELFTAESIKNRINQILNRNLTKDHMLPHISEFEVTPLNGSTVNCKWKTNYSNDNSTFTIYYNPVKYLEPSNYSKNFAFEDDFLFLRINGSEVNITNLLPHTIYDFYITINYRSSENDEDFFYQLNKFLTKKLRNKFYVKHRSGLNQTEKLGKQQSLTKTQKKYEKQFRTLESVIDEFENLLAFFKGQRRRVRTLEDPPSAPTEFTGVALDSSSVQLSWRSPIERNGIINGFEIYYTTNNDKYSLPIDEWSNLSIEGTQFISIIKQLNASTEYKFLVKARNSAGLGKSTPKLNIRTLKENYDTFEKFLTPEPDLIDTNTFRYTKYEDMSYRDILSLNETNEILFRIGIGVGCLFACITVMAVCNK